MTSAPRHPFARFVLRSRQAVEACWAVLKTWEARARDGKALELWIAEYAPIRTLPQNRLLHKLFAIVSTQRAWAGHRLDTEGWKRVLLGGFYGQQVGPNPFFPTEPLVMNVQRSSKLKCRGDDQMGDFLDAVMAWAIDEGVDLDGLEGEDDPPGIWTPPPPTFYPGQERPKRTPLREDGLRRIARNAPACMGCGKVNEGDVVMAHANWSEYGKGGGQKADDIFVAALCWDCHTAVDQGAAWARQEKKDYWLAAHVKTLAWLFREGFLVFVPRPA